MRYSFSAPADVYVYFDEIASHMVELFGISAEEAVGRINATWPKNYDFGEEHLMFHENLDFWSRDIYFGHDSSWWKNPPGLTPLPYPESPDSA